MSAFAVHFFKTFSKYGFYIGLLQRLEEDVNVNSYIVNDKLPKEVAAKQRIVSTLQRVAAQPAMGQQELEAVNKQVMTKHEVVYMLLSCEYVTKLPEDLFSV